MAAENARIGELLFAAQNETNKTAKLTTLKQVQELIMTDGANRQALLDSFFEEIMGFSLDTNADVRKEVISFIETACKQDVGLFQSGAEHLQYALETEENPKVVQRAIQAVVNLYRSIFQACALHLKPKLLQGAWESLSHIKGILLSLVAHDNEGIRTIIYKFMETVILAHTMRTRDSEMLNPNAEDVGLDCVPLSHPYLSGDDLHEEAKEHFGAMLEVLGEEKLTATGATALTACLVSVARQRPRYMGRVIAALVGFFRHPPAAFSPSQVASIQRALKPQMLALLKHEASLEYHDLLVPVLEELNVDTSLISQYDKRDELRFLALENKRTLEIKAPQSASKRSKVEFTFDMFEHVPLPAIIDLVLQSILNLPETIPDISAPGSVTLTEKEKLAKRAILGTTMLGRSEASSSSDPNVPSTPATSPGHASIAPPRRGSKSTTMKQAFRLAPLKAALGMRPRVHRLGLARLCLQRLYSHARAVDDEKEAALALTLDKEVNTNAAPPGQGQPEVTPMTDSVSALGSGNSDPSTTVLKAKPLTQFSVDEGTLNSEFVQVLNKIAGHTHLHSLAFPLTSDQLEYPAAPTLSDSSQLEASSANRDPNVTAEPTIKDVPVSKPPADSSDVPPLLPLNESTNMSAMVDSLMVAYACRDISARMTFVLSYLYEVYFAEQSLIAASSELPGDKLEPFARYTWCLNELLKALLPQVNSETSWFSALLLNLPLIPPLFSSIVEPLCLGEASHTITFSTLRQLVLTRPPCRSDLLRLLLHHSTCERDSVRAGAIAVVIKLHKFDELRKEIEMYALKALSQLTTNDDDASWTPERVKMAANLFVRLIPFNSKLIHYFFQTYGQASLNVKKMMFPLIDQPILALGMDNEDLLRAIETSSPSTEMLALRSLHVLTGKVKPKAQLVDICRQKSDPRFLISVLPGLSEGEIRAALPAFLGLGDKDVEQVFARLLVPHPPFPLSELLVLVHLPPCTVENGLKATKLIFNHKSLLTHDVLAVALARLLEAQPTPPLFMRTVIQAVQLCPSLKHKVMEILRTLISRQIWKDSGTWRGFVMCCRQTQPLSFPVIAALPPPQLALLLETAPELRHPLFVYVSALPENQVPKAIVNAIYAINTSKDAGRDEKQSL